MVLHDCEDKNDDDDGDIYENDDIPDRNYHFEDGSLAGTGAGEVESLTLDGGSGRLISDGECGTHDDGDDNSNIDESG